MGGVKRRGGGTLEALGVCRFYTEEITEVRWTVGDVPGVGGDGGDEITLAHVASHATEVNMQCDSLFASHASNCTAHVITVHLCDHLHGRNHCLPV